MGIAVDDTVRGRATPVIGPASQHIARVDQDGPWDHGGLKPRPRWRADGQPGQGGLGQHGQKTRIRVWRHAILRILPGLRGRIVRQAEGILGLAKRLGKVLRRQLQGRGIGGQQTLTELLHGLTVGDHSVAKPRHALRCGLAGSAGQTICSRAMGLGGLISLLGLALAAAGAGILWRTGRRLMDAEGPSGWIAGEGLTVALAGILIALLIPAHHCPAGYEMTQVFHACRALSTQQVPQLILHPPTAIAWKLAVAGAAVVVGIVLARWRAVPWQVASIVTVGTVATATLLLADRSVGLPAI